ncbi:MAG: hypothetical protein HY922_02270 [Elusimicrobia bacterium]|nr:hypothetical protein [Elusimicrobiota bacterium]
MARKTMNDRPLLAKLSRWAQDHALLISAFGLALLILWQAASMHRWACADSRPPTWDEAVHLTLADQYLDALRKADLWRLFKTQRYPGHSPYPPVYHFLLVPWLAFLEPGSAALSVNWIVYAFLLAGIWLLGGRVSGVWHGLLAAFLLWLSPFPQQLSRQVLVDLLLSAWALWCYVFFLESEGFAKKGPSLALGACIGLGTLTKWTLPIYLLPMAFSLPGAWRKNRVNLLRCAAAACAIAGPWLAVNIPEGLGAMRRAARLGYDEGFRLWRLGSWLYYPKNAREFFPWPTWLVLACGAAWALKKKTRFAWTLAGWLGLSWIAWTCVSTRDIRFVTPAMVALPVMGVSALPAWALPLAAAPAAWAYQGPRPAREDWHHADILDAIERSKPKRAPAALLVIPNLARLNSNVLNWAIRSGRRQGISVGGEETEIPEWCDFVLVKSGDPGVYLGPESLRILRQAFQERSLFRRHFLPAAAWHAPDGGEIALFMRKPERDQGPVRRDLGSLTIRSADLAGVRLVRLSSDTYRLEADSILLKTPGLRLINVRALAEGAELIFEGGRAHVMRVRSVTLQSLRLPWDSLREAAGKKLPGLRLDVEPRGDSLEISLAWKLLRLRLGFSWSQEPGALILRAKGLRLLGLPVPFANGRTLRLSFEPRPPKQDYRLRLSRLHAEPDCLAVGE